MTLSMSLLAGYLEKYKPEVHITDDRRTISGIRFLTEQISRSTLNYVYLGAADRFFQDPKLTGGWILASGQNHLLCADADYEELLNDVLSAFDFYNDLEQQLIILSARHESAQDILRVAAPVLSCALVLFDLDGNRITSLNEERVTDPRLAVNLREQKKLGTNVISSTFLDRDGQVSHDLSDVPQLLHPKSHPQEECVCMYVSRGEEHLGFILCFPIGEQEVRTAMTLVPLLAGYLGDCDEFSSAGSLLQSESGIFIRLLNGEELLPPVLQRFEDNLGFSGSRQLFLIRSLRIQNYTIRHMLIDDLRKSGLHVLVSEYEDMTAVLAPEKETELVLRVVGRRIQTENVSIGLSMPIQRPGQLHAACRQAAFALEQSPEPGIRRCQDLAMDYLLQTLSGDAMTEYLLHPALSALKSYDDEHNTELFSSLCAYAGTGFSQAETAERLHIHLNTLKYRIRRITELTGITFRDHQENLYLQLSAALCPSPGTP